MTETSKTLEWTIDEDKKTIAITWPSKTMQFSAQDLHDLQTALGSLRNELLPPVPVSLPEDLRTMQFHRHMHIRALLRDDGSRVPTEVGAFLAFQSPLFGWFDYYLDPEYCRGLVAWLQGHGDQLLAPKGTTLQ